MSDSSDNSNQPSAIRTATQRLEDASRAPYVKGLPEWDMFPDDASRRAAIEEIERGMMPRTLKDVLGFLLAVILFLSGPLIVSFLITNYLLPMWQWKDYAFWTMTLVGYSAVVYLALRRNMPKALRNQLIEHGVPVCIRCGYDLRGLPVDRTHCPECGRAFDDAVMQLVQRGRERESAAPSAATDEPR